MWVCRLALVLAMALALLGCARANAPTPPDREIILSDQAADRLEQQLAELDRSTDPIRIEISEQELNSYVARQIGDDTSIENVRLWLQPGEFWVQATLHARHPHTLLLRAQIQVDNGAAQVTLDGLWLDGRSVPRLVRNSLCSSLNAALTDIQTTFQLERVTVEEGSLRITGSWTPSP